ncbi:EF-hand domain-containing protein [Streptomyces sp. NPDC001404]|uniref:EF-hand domain-containing protein n=1 Tax=Streptomyces sp. NPDC001404 TaxID=3364571 RepID=UPI0036A6991A
MTSEVLRERYAHRFRAHDADGDGWVDEGDFVRRARQLVDGLGEPADSARAKALVEGVRDGWRSIADIAGVPVDGRIDENRFVAALASAYDSGIVADIMRPSVAAHVALADRDGNGYVDEGEFVNAQQAAGIGADDARKAFSLLDRDGDGRLAIAEWQSAVLEFYTSTGSDVPGVRILGMKAR